MTKNRFANMHMPATQILFVGPFPPPLGGAIVESLTLWNYLREHTDIKATRLRTNASTLARCLLPLRFILALFKVDTVFIYGSHRGISRLSVALVPICKLFRVKCVIKITGGNLWEYYEASHPFWQYALERTLFSRCLLLLETKYLVENFQERFSNIKWFPMTRQISSNPSVNEAISKDNKSFENTANAALKVAYFGHIRKTKGIPELIEASRLIDNVKIDAYGQFIGLDVSVFDSGNVHYKGVVQPDEVLSTMSQYDVLALPTYYPGEGYPGVLIEAKNAGLAIVATKWRSIPEIVENESSGLLIEPNNATSLAQALERLHNDRALLKKMQEKSAQSFNDYDIDKWGGVLLDYLR